MPWYQRGALESAIEGLSLSSIGGLLRRSFASIRAFRSAPANPDFIDILLSKVGDAHSVLRQPIDGERSAWNPLQICAHAAPARQHRRSFESILATIEVLLKRGADISAVNSTQATVLHIASRCSDQHRVDHTSLERTLWRLIDRGADGRARDKNGNTFLDILKKSNRSFYNRHYHKLTLSKPRPTYILH